MKTNAIIRIVLFSIAIVVLLGMLGSGLLFRMYAYESSTGEVSRVPVSGDVETVSVNPDQIREVKIEWVAGNITMEISEMVDRIQIAETKTSNCIMLCKQSGSELLISFCEDAHRFIGFGSHKNVSKDLHILVPAGWFCSVLEIDAASANVILRNLEIGELDFDGASGTCDITDCHVDRMDLDAASGDVWFEGSLNELDFDGVSADCTLVLSNCPRSMELEGMSGNLDLTLPQGCGFTVKMNGMSKDLNCEFETTLHNGAHVHGDGACRIRMDAMSGNIVIRKSHQNHH